MFVYEQTDRRPVRRLLDPAAQRIAQGAHPRTRWHLQAGIALTTPRRQSGWSGEMRPINSVGVAPQHARHQPVPRRSKQDNNAQNLRYASAEIALPGMSVEHRAHTPARLIGAGTHTISDPTSKQRAPTAATRRITTRCPRIRPNREPPLLDRNPARRVSKAIAALRAQLSGFSGGWVAGEGGRGGVGVKTTKLRAGHYRSASQPPHGAWMAASESRNSSARQVGGAACPAAHETAGRQIGVDRDGALRPKNGSHQTRG